MQKYYKIGIIVATKIEAKEIIKQNNFTLLYKQPFNVYTNDKMILILSGISKTNAAAATSFLLTTYDIGVVINIGAAGSTSNKSQIGDIHSINEVIELDRPALFKKGFVRHKPDNVKSKKSLILATQDKAIITEQERTEVSQHATLVDMEAAAIVQSCKKFKIQCLVYKIVTDIPGSKKMDILFNIKKLAHQLADFLKIEVFPSLL